MEPFRDDTDLIAELRALRPEPRQAFAAELDERAATGFPRRSPGSAPLQSRLAARLRALQPRRLLLPAAGTALATMVVATAIIAIGERGTSAPSSLHPDSASGGAVAEKKFNDAPRPTGGEDLSRPSTGTAAQGGLSSAGSADGNLSSEAATPSSEVGPYASKANHRDVERSAEIVLGADPAKVGKDAARVFETVHAYHGIVLSSSIRDGGEGEAGARFELLIPSARLGDALAAFSGIDEVRSRHEGSADITAPTIGVGERLQDSRAKIDGLLGQLAAADTDSERAATEVELRAERRHAASLRSRLSTLKRRGNFSRVSLGIQTGASSTSPGESGNWGVGDAVGDAGHILAIAAGVTIVGLAIVGPLALIALLAWLARQAWIRHHRERALG